MITSHRIRILFATLLSLGLSTFLTADEGRTEVPSPDIRWADALARRLPIGDKSIIVVPLAARFIEQYDSTSGTSRVSSNDRRDAIKELRDKYVDGQSCFYVTWADSRESLSLGRSRAPRANYSANNKGLPIQPYIEPPPTSGKLLEAEMNLTSVVTFVSYRAIPAGLFDMGGQPFICGPHLAFDYPFEFHVHLPGEKADSVLSWP